MFANYHTHTPLCGHAVGEMREYVESAIRGRIKKLGFADHAPQFYDGTFVSGMRMLPSYAEGYVKEVRALAEEYKNEIEIFVGFEAEYFPPVFDRLLSFCRNNGVDYLIMGQHSLINEPENIRTSAHWKDKKVLTHYVDEVLEGLSTGSFSYLCHPDLFLYTGDDEEFYMAENERLCIGAKKLGIPLEINIHGYIDGRYYPSDRFFGIAKKVGNDTILGVDAHDPSELCSESNLAKIGEFVKRNGLTPLDDITLRKI